MENKRKTGSEKEKLAAEYLAGLGYEILEKNFFSHFGEIDLIARKGTALVFVEVKYRKNQSRGNPLEAVDWRKQKRICRTALYYLTRHGLSADIPCRFDVIAITGKGAGEEFTHVRNAFEFRP